jgi:hypothetical protein
MLDNGPGTLWEYWNVGATDNVWSRNHPAFSATTVWLYETLAGIRQTDESVGFDHPLIAPTIDPTTTSVNATKTTMYGDVTSNWDTTTPGYSFVGRMSIPFNTDATVQIPTTGVVNPTITEGSTVIYANGGFVSSVAVPGVSGLSASASAVTFSVGSGSYRFSVRAGDQPGRVDDASPAWTYRGFDAYGGQFPGYAVNGTLHNGDIGSTATYTCTTCTGFGLITSTGPQRGIARISIDGGPPIDVDLYRAAWSYEQTVWTSALLAAGRHTITITSGGRNPLSTVSAIDIDAIDIRP